MALPMLVNNAECGPSNGLQSLSKRFDQDRGFYQDRVITDAAGSSREGFRTHPSPAPYADQDAARFFSHGSHTFNMKDVGASLPSLGVLQVQHRPQITNANWASDFLLHRPASQGPQGASNDAVTHAPVSHIPGPQNAQAWTGMTLRPSFVQPMPMHNQTILPKPDQLSWDREFATQEQSLSASLDQQVEPEASSIDQDELARTAGMLLDTIRDEQNPKFKNSEFMGLMQQLRDREIIVEGNQMVENNTSYAPGSSSSKGKGRAVEPIPYSTGGSYAPSFETTQTPTFLPNHDNLLQQDDLDAYLQRENADYMQFWKDVADTKASRIPPSTEWDHLQHDWDHFEATNSGIRPIEPYQFQHNNPYLLGDSTRIRQNNMQDGQPLSIFESVLELEAVVQRDPSNAQAWYDLGVKQQENEREQKALQALNMAVELDPSHLSSWLALAISHTNDGDRHGTFTAIYDWARRNARYSDATESQLESLSSESAIWDQNSSHQLIDCLMTMARLGSSGGVDADVQIALAVLFNSNEDYEKAQDCFRTALAVRPDDWLLYNRVGATMANNGHAEEALDYYYRALEMNPSYVRARFNLGISCISLKRYQEAAQHILDALVLQESDAAPDVDKLNDKRGLMSRALWDSLKTACLHMQRLDLAILCDQRDLESFRQRFAV
ncbi:TPR-like protein [Hymenopellis radicata]|nr:TPR-like protein [Hymenopellis radicata]